MAEQITVKYGTDGEYQSIVTLDGDRYQFRFRNCGPIDRWFVSVQDTDGNTLLGLVPVVPGVDLFLPYKHLSIPQGVLFVLSPDDSSPTRDTVDSSVLVLYS